MYNRKARTRIALPKDWSKTWSLSLPVLESKVYIFGHSTKNADAHSWLSSLKITLLQRSQSRNASCVFQRLLMPPGENASSQSLPEHYRKPVTRQKPSSALRSVYKCDECQCALACQLENKSSTWPLAQKADSPVQHLLL